MIYQQDWLLRQIEMIIQAILNKICKKKSQTSYENCIEIQQSIAILLKDKKICEAENIIFENVDSKQGNYNYFAIVLDFYSALNAMTEEELNKCNFSHQEIKDGLISFCHYYEQDEEIKQLLKTFYLTQYIEGNDII